MSNRNLNDNEFHQQAIAGGASRHYETGDVPDRGYMLGGARNNADIPYPEIKRPVDEFELSNVRQHARQIRDHFGSGQALYQGAWVEDGDVVLDASEQINDRVTAMTEAKKRGERAIYDIDRDRDIDISDMARKVRN